jgi:hypothetical protein
MVAVAGVIVNSEGEGRTIIVIVLSLRQGVPSVAVTV